MIKNIKQSYIDTKDIYKDIFSSLNLYGRLILSLWLVISFPVLFIVLLGYKK